MALREEIIFYILVARRHFICAAQFHPHCDKMFSVRKLPVVYFVVRENVADEDDAGDEVHEDGKEGETVPSRLARHLLSHNGVGVVEREEEAAEGDDAGAVVKHKLGEEQQEELDVLLHGGRNLSKLYGLW